VDESIKNFSQNITNKELII